MSDEIVDPIPVQIKAASFVTLAYTGGIPTASSTGYDAKDAIDATEDSNPPAIPPISRKTSVKIDGIKLHFLFSINIYYNAVKSKLRG